MAQKQFDLKSSPVHLLRRCSQIADDLFESETRGSDLTSRQLIVLIAADANEGASQTALVAATGIDRSTLADIVARMIQRDLLARKRTEADARANAVRVTAKGARALKSALTAMKAVEKRLMSKVPVSKRADLLRLLAAIASLGDDN